MPRCDTYDYQPVQRQGDLELPHNRWDFFEEVRRFHSLGCCRPRHLISNQVTDDGSRDLQTQTCEEDCIERCKTVTQVGCQAVRRSFQAMWSTYEYI